MADNNTLLPYDGILRFDAVYDAENQRPAAASAATGVYLGRFVLEQDTNKIYQKIYKTGIGYDWRYVSQLGNYVEKDEIVSIINDGNEKISYSKIDGTPNLSNYITTNNLISKINEAADTININKINGINNYVTSASIIQTINSSPEDVKISADKLAISGGNFDNYYTKTQINNILGTRGPTSTSNYPYYWYDTSTGRISVAPSESSSLLQTSLTEILTQLAQSSLTAGNGINIDNNHEISVKIDSSTIAFDSSHQLQVKLISSGGITSGSNGIYVKLKSNGGISCNENGELYLTNGSSGGTTYTAGDGIFINSNKAISINTYSSSGLGCNSAGQIEVKHGNSLTLNSNDNIEVRCKYQGGLTVDTDGLKVWDITYQLPANSSLLGLASNMSGRSYIKQLDFSRKINNVLYNYTELYGQGYIYSSATTAINPRISITGNGLPTNATITDPQQIGMVSFYTQTSAINTSLTVSTYPLFYGTIQYNETVLPVLTFEASVTNGLAYSFIMQGCISNTQVTL